MDLRSSLHSGTQIHPHWQYIRQKRSAHNKHWDQIRRRPSAVVILAAPARLTRSTPTLRIPRAVRRAIRLRIAPRPLIPDLRTAAAQAAANDDTPHAQWRLQSEKKFIRNYSRAIYRTPLSRLSAVVRWRPATQTRDSRVARKGPSADHSSRRGNDDFLSPSQLRGPLRARAGGR